MCDVSASDRGGGMPASEVVSSITMSCKSFGMVEEILEREDALAFRRPQIAVGQQAR